ncbi:hypothetical protein ODW18_25875 [Escherichia coli]|uniref:hypothetical protein n=1 Tax=Escherichia coli TaxID=562 RepID=UPI00164F3AB8|nr:hypothetical protein [Escherichia coli]ELI0791648.1 hypothetical protein [Escherichia coli]ELR8832934.1 hypothetical protein [Escherichia coli]EME9887484.1 hypothetical protein [Salmonella enterica]MCV8944362.1 hypothetical protein [Escherichia coli]
MSEINPRQAKYADIHAKLTDRMQSVRVILEQMEGHEYAAISTYMNNMEAIACFYEEAGESLSEPDFLNYLKQNDLNLFIEILSVGRAVSLMKNLLVNIGVNLDIENYCTIRASPACQRRCLRFLSAL